MSFTAGKHNVFQSTSTELFDAKSDNDTGSVRAVDHSILRKLPTPMQRRSVVRAAGPSDAMAQCPEPWVVQEPWLSQSSLVPKSSYRERLQARGQKAMQHSLQQATSGSPVQPTATRQTLMWFGGLGCEGAQLPADPLPRGFERLQWPCEEHAPATFVSTMFQGYPPYAGTAASGWMPSMSSPIAPTQASNATWSQQDLMATLMPAASHLPKEEIAAQLRAAAPCSYDD